MSHFDDSPGLAEHDLEPMPPALPSMQRIVRHGYRAEPRLLVASLAMTILEALPDVLVALWLALITRGLIIYDEVADLLRAAAPSVGSATASISISRGTSPGCRRALRPWSITSGRGISIVLPCCAPVSSPSTTCSAPCSPSSGGSCVWPL